MSHSQENLYDAVPYPGATHSFTHPRHLETMATLLGIGPVPIATCRVLELGCASGDNLIPQAIDLPAAGFLGIDLSGRQIEQGRSTVEALGLGNIELRQADILEVNDDWGKFDYIICHGIFSWVPPNVQDKILEICRRNLVPNGVAIVSYNTYPGWHLVQVVRDVMRYHVARFDDTDRQMSQAMAALKFMAERSNSNRASGKPFTEELEILQQGVGNSHIFHDHLEPYNLPLYFHEFVERAESAGLQYLSETELAPMLLSNFPEKVVRALKGLPQVQQEQYLDFLRGNRFRRTLLCHKEASFSRSSNGGQMMKFHVSLASLPAPAEVDFRNDEPCEFKWKDSSLTTANRMQKAAVGYLTEIFPNYVHFRELQRAALGKLNLTPDENRDDPKTGRQALADGLMNGYGANVFRICLNPPRCVTHVSDYPTASPLSRMQAAKGRVVTNQLHARVSLDDLCRYVTFRLDGRHDRRALAHSIEQSIASGGLTARLGGQSQESLDSSAVSNALDEALSRISKAGLLIA